MSTDPAHSLSDAFRSQFGADPISPNSAALPNLDVMEVNPTATVEVFNLIKVLTWVLAIVISYTK